MAGLSLKHIGKSYGVVEVIKDLNLDIHDGEFLVLVGPSGCGKSTLLRMIAGIEDITGGTLSIDGQLVNDLPASKRELSMVFQSYALYPHMSVRKNLAFGLQNLKMPKDEIARRVANASKILQIEPLLERKPRQLSGGQKQRVAIGRSIVREPKLFLFDEPLSNLDAELRVQMRVELAALYQRLKTTMIYVTHDQVEAMTLASRIVVMRGGHIEQVGSPEELYNTPANLFVAGFIGSPKINQIPAQVDANSGIAKSADFTAIALAHLDGYSGDVTLCIRPEAVHLDAGNVQATGTVRLVEYLGADTLIYVDLPSGQEILMHGSGKDRHKPGDRVTLGIDESDLHVFDVNGSRLEPTQQKVS